MPEEPAKPTIHPSDAPCQICGRVFDSNDLIPLEMVRPGVSALIEKDHPTIEDRRLICEEDLNRYRRLYTQSLIEEEKGELTALEEEVLRSLHESDLLASNLNEQFGRRTFGEMLSDKMADFGGSWAFILSFAAVLTIWIVINLQVRTPFDPFPFILLNLILSCIAAIQAPIIMMSQNRQEHRDRLRAEEDYKVNLKAELEIRALIAKIDQLRQHQWRRLLELQHIQLDLMNELSKGQKSS
jgi:Predicted membrane protein